MNIKELNLKEIYKRLQIGVELSTVLIAFGISEKDIPSIQIALENPEDEWWDVFRSKVIQCRAQAKILMIGKMFKEGGFAGAKYLLERMENSTDNRLIESKQEVSESVEEIDESDLIEGEWNWNAD